MSYNFLFEQYLSYTLAIFSITEPQKFEEACQDPNWMDVMKKDIKALQQNKKWYVLDLPIGKTPIGCKWIT